MVDTRPLGQRLIDLQLVTDAQWKDALDRAGAGGLPAALDLLTRARAWWSPEGDRSPALTPFQVQLITRTAEGDNLEKLNARVRWNNYLLLDELGRGGMGVVMKGWDVENRRYVAIKRSRKDTDASEDAKKRLEREAGLFRRLDHPKIARFYSWEVFHGTSLLVLEYLPGRTLKDLVEGRGPNRPVPWTAVAEWAVDVLEALDYAHGNNPNRLTIVHRDIKPSNVMLQMAADGGRYMAKLLDLGLGKAIRDSEGGAGDPGNTIGGELTKRFELIGTFQYMPPEQWRGAKDIGPAADIYCLGGTVYFALTGRPPFDASDMAEFCLMHTSDPPPVVRKLRPDVPIQVDLLIRQMMEKAPDRRGTAAQLRKQFQQAAAAAPQNRLSGQFQAADPGQPAANSSGPIKVAPSGPSGVPRTPPGQRELDQVNSLPYPPVRPPGPGRPPAAIPGLEDPASIPDLPPGMARRAAAAAEARPPQFVPLAPRAGGPSLGVGAYAAQETPAVEAEENGRTMLYEGVSPLVSGPVPVPMPALPTSSGPTRRPTTEGGGLSGSTLTILAVALGVALGGGLLATLWAMGFFGR